MKKNSLTRVMLGCLGLVLTITTLGAAPGSLIERDHLFIRGGYSFPTQSYLEGGFTVSAGGTKFIGRKLGIQLEGQYQQLRSINEAGSGTEKPGQGDISLIAINGSLCYYLSSSSRLGFYVLGGCGYSFSSISLDNDYNDLGFNIEENPGSGFSFHAGAGFDWVISNRLGFNLEARYTMLDANGDWEVSDSRSSAWASGDTETDMSRITVMAGIKFYL